VAGAIIRRDPRTSSTNSWPHSSDARIGAFTRRRPFQCHARPDSQTAACPAGTQIIEHDSHGRCFEVGRAPRGSTGASERGHSVGAVSDRFHLPRARDAVIPTDKLVAYALDPDHPRGRHKARVFAAVLGIGKSDWQYLRDQLLEAVVDADVRGTRITAHGVLYDVLVLVDGLNGATQRVATIWLVAGIARRAWSPLG
jgi:hypothetical protein